MKVTNQANADLQLRITRNLKFVICKQVIIRSLNKEKIRKPRKIFH